MSCITARASLSATFASSARSYPRRTASGPSKDSTHCRQPTAGSTALQGQDVQLTLQMLEMLLDPETGPREPESGEEPHKVREHDRRKHGRAPLAEHLPRVEIELLPSEWKSKLSEAATPASFVEVTSQVVATAEPEGCVVELAVGRVLVRVRRRGTPR